MLHFFAWEGSLLFPRAPRLVALQLFAAAVDLKGTQPAEPEGLGWPRPRA